MEDKQKTLSLNNEFMDIPDGFCRDTPFSLIDKS